MRALRTALFVLAECAPAGWSVKLGYSTAWPQSPAAWFDLGVSGGGTVAGTFISAAQCYERALATDPWLTAAWFNLGNAGGGTVAGTHYDAARCYALSQETGNAAAALERDAKGGAAEAAGAAGDGCDVM